MDFLVLGPLRVRNENRWMEIGEGKPRMVLGVLLAGAGRVVSTDRLLEEMWGADQPSSGLKTLRYHVWKLRELLEPDRGRDNEGVIGTEAGGYVLRVEPGQVDAGRFKVLATEGADLLGADRVEPARERLGEALGLWRGPAYADFRYEGFAQGEIARLEELRLACLEDRIAADLELGRHRMLVAELSELTTTYPLRERLWGLLMVALYRSDRQAEALRAYQTARTVLGEELGIEPNASLRRLEEQILLHELPFEPPELEAPRSDNLPARLSSFVGRVDELAAVEDLLTERRLVTLSGFAGVGKTSLASEVARRLVGGFDDGVWLVELAGLTDPSYVVGEIASILDVRGSPGRLLDALVDAMAPISMLLVVDNCEHLLTNVARVVDVLVSGCPKLRVLATSREPLGLPGEQIYPVPPLDVPPDDADLSPVAASEIEAVQLFIDRARESRPDFDLDEGNVDAVVAICRRLDGIPLALELAAARLRMLTPQQLLDRLEDQLGILTAGAARPERHRTLRAAIEWSHQLLENPEQTLLRRLAVFRGGFTLPAVESVCAGDGIGPGDVLDLIGHLVGASLLTVRDGEPTRFGMLESVHQYAEALLAESGGEPTLRRRHATYYAALVPTYFAFDTPEFGEMLDRVAIEHDNCRSALAWAIQAGDGDLALRLAACIARHWNLHGFRDQIVEWLPLVLDVAPLDPSVERAIVLQHLGVALALSGRRREASPLVDELNQAARKLDDATISAFAANLEAMYLDACSDIRAARDVEREHAGVLRDLRHPYLTIHLSNIAEGSVWLGDFDDAANVIDEMEELIEASSQGAVPVDTSSFRGMLAHYRGDLHAAEQYLVEALATCRRLNVVSMEPQVLRELVAVSLASGHDEAAKAWGRRLILSGKRMAQSDAIAEGRGLLARAELHQRNVAAACAEGTKALAVAVDYDILQVLALVLGMIGQIAWAGGDPPNAVLLHAGAESLRTQVGFVHPAPRARELENELRLIRASLGRHEFNVAWKTGASLTREELITEAEHVLQNADSSPRSRD